MKYSVTHSFDTLAELTAHIKLIGSEAADAPAPKKRAAPPVEDDEPAPKKAAAKKALPPEDDELDYETQVRPVIVKFAKDFGREELGTILEQFTNAATDEPVTKGQELSPEDWPAALAKLAKSRKRLEAAAED